MFNILQFVSPLGGKFGEFSGFKAGKTRVAMRSSPEKNSGVIGFFILLVINYNSKIGAKREGTLDPACQSYDTLSQLGYKLFR